MCIRQGPQKLIDTTRPEACSKQKELCDVRFQKTNLRKQSLDFGANVLGRMVDETVTANADSQDSCAFSRWYTGSFINLGSSIAAPGPKSLHFNKFISNPRLGRCRFNNSKAFFYGFNCATYDSIIQIPHKFRSNQSSRKRSMTVSIAMANKTGP